MVLSLAYHSQIVVFPQKFFFTQPYRISSYACTQIHLQPTTRGDIFLEIFFTLLSLHQHWALKIIYTQPLQCLTSALSSQPEWWSLLTYFQPALKFEISSFQEATAIKRLLPFVFLSLNDPVLLVIQCLKQLFLIFCAAL